MDALKTIPELLKLPIKIIVALCIASGLILLLPNNLIEKLYMLSFRENYGFIIGIVFIVSLSITVCYILFYLVPKIWERLTRKSKNEKLKKGQRKFLSSLNNNELEIIKLLIKEEDNTLKLPMNRGIVKKLEHYFVISPAGTNFAIDLEEPIIPYFLQPWVFEYFDKNGNIIKEKLEDKEEN